jgi:hypothetical protein
MRKLTTHTDIDVIPLQNEDGLVDGKPVWGADGVTKTSEVVAAMLEPGPVMIGEGIPCNVLVKMNDCGEYIVHGWLDLVREWRGIWERGWGTDNFLCCATHTHAVVHSNLCMVVGWYAAADYLR